ncbi:rhomboid family intramembrane serine protease [Vagococcus sp. JNUCC 83]
MREYNTTRWMRFKRGPYFTYLFLAIQIVIFILMELVGLKQGIMSGSEDVNILEKFGAITHYSIVLDGEYWRFITPIFVHIGFFHLLLNSLGLYFVGRILEPLIGHTRFFIVYLFSGIFGNLWSFAFGSTNSISAGASTSLFGIFAAFIILGQIYKNHPAIKYMSRNMTLLILMNLVMNLFDSGVDIMGHFGGALSGLLLMVIVGVPSNKLGFNGNIDKKKRILALIVFVLLSVGCLYKGFSI